MSLKDLRATLVGDEKGMVRDAMNHIEQELIIDLEAMILGVRATRTISSCLPRIALIPKGKKGHNIGLEVSSRISAKRKPMKKDYHLTDDGQLKLGFEEFEDPDDAGDKKSPVGFDAEKNPATSGASSTAPVH